MFPQFGVLETGNTARSNAGKSSCTVEAIALSGGVDEILDEDDETETELDIVTEFEAERDACDEELSIVCVRELLSDTSLEVTAELEELAEERYCSSRAISDALTEEVDRSLKTAAGCVFSTGFRTVITVFGFAFKATGTATDDTDDTDDLLSVIALVFSMVGTLSMLIDTHDEDATGSTMSAGVPTRGGMFTTCLAW